MSDPQDLLYTNNYLSASVLSENTITKDLQYYDRFTNYQDKNSKSDLNKYIEEDEYEESQINLNKTLNNKWTVDSKKNHYPLFDTYINDISTNRYKKEVISRVSIDSNYRDLSLYVNPNSFTINLSKTFNNVRKLIINDLNFTNINTSITNSNNNLSWQYPSQNFLQANNIDTTIIPVTGTNTIAYSSLPNSVFSYTTTDGTNYVQSVDNYMVYQTNITPAYYSIDTFIENLRSNTSAIVHGYNYEQTDLKIVEQPYLSQPKRIGACHLFSCKIDPLTSIVRFTNRIEELQIVAIQTFSPYETNFSNVDPFYYYSSMSSTIYNIDTNMIYVTVEAYTDSSYQFYNNIYCLQSCNPFPLVLTNIVDNIGGIDSNLITYTPFFDLNIYLTNGYTEADIAGKISYYKYIDTITIKNTATINGSFKTISNVYLRFGLSLSSGNIHGNAFNPNGIAYKPTITETIIYSNTLYTYITALRVFLVYTGTLDTSVLPLIGRALLYRWIYDKYNLNYINYEIETLSEKKRSVLHILGWPIANETYKIFTVEQNLGYNFVHTNYHANITNQQGIIVYQNKTNEIPNISLNLQNISGKYYFVNNSYIYIRLHFNTNDTLKVDNYMATVSDNTLLYNQQYINSNLFNVGIGEDYTYVKECANIVVFTKDYSNIFAKIMVSNTPGNYDIITSNIINNNCYTINYDFVMDNLNEVTIELLDSNFKVLELSNQFSFTLELHEMMDILKETLINTKTNNVNSTGNLFTKL